MATRKAVRPERRHAEEFKLSVTAALKQQLTAQFDGMPRVVLSEERLAELDGLPGVYELFDGERLVYIGKADSLPDRLGNHLHKLRGRARVDMATIGFRCLYVEEDLSTVAPERMLIAEHRAAELEEARRSGAKPGSERLWNTIGFGNNDPGRNRDRSMVKDSHFDFLYPINLDFPIDLSGTAISDARDLAIELKAVLPYNFRFDQRMPKVPLSDPLAVSTAMTARIAFEVLAKALPDGWAVTALPGYVICYMDDPRTYDSRLESWRATGSHGVDHEEHVAAFSPEPLTPDEEDAPAFEPVDTSGWANSGS